MIHATSFTDRRQSAASGIFIAGLICASVGTTSAAALATDDAERFYESRAQTAASDIPTASADADAQAAISQVRRLTGLTWDQLARVFGVSRRAVHFWASGEPMSAANQERLARVLSILRRADRGSAEVNRAQLFAPSEEGPTAFDLLVDGEDELAANVLGQGAGGGQSPRLAISEAQRAERRAPPPQALVDTLPGSLPERSLGPARKARSRKVGGNVQG